MPRQKSPYRQRLERGQAARQTVTQAEPPPHAVDRVGEVASTLAEWFYQRLQLSSPPIRLTAIEDRLARMTAAEKRAWRTLAARLISRRVDFGGFIDAQFRCGDRPLTWSSRHNEDLLGVRCWQRWQKFAADPERLEELNLAIQSQMNKAQDEIEEQVLMGAENHEDEEDFKPCTSADATFAVICDEDPPLLTPLIKHLLALSAAASFPGEKAKFLSLAAEHEESAAVQYITGQKLYEQSSLARFFPPGWSGRALQIYIDLFQ